MNMDYLGTSEELKQSIWGKACSGKAPWSPARLQAEGLLLAGHSSKCATLTNWFNHHNNPFG